MQRNFAVVLERPQNVVTLVTKPIAKARLALIDVAKGVGILLIVLGHNPIFSSSNPGFADLLSSFRLPFFFFISGTLFSFGKKSVGKVAFDRADAWLKPTAVVVIAFGLTRVLAGQAGPEPMLLGLLFATGFTLTWTPMWFLPHLWLLYVFATVLMTFGHHLVDTRVKRVLGLCVMGLLGYGCLQLFDSGLENAACLHNSRFDMDLFDCGLPFSADLLLITTTYFLAGYFVSAQVKAFQPHYLLGALAFAVLLGLHAGFGYTVDFNTRRYDHVLISTLQAMAGIYTMLCICSLLTHSARALAFFAYFGRASLFILIFHAWLTYKLFTVLPRVLEWPWLVAVVMYLVSLMVPIMLWEITKRNKVMALLMLPRQQKKPASAHVRSATDVQA